MQDKTTYTRNYRHRHPEKAKAHTAIRQKIKSGKLVAQPCARCNATPTHAHHEDYSKPLDIVWLCEPCHKARHKELAAENPEKWGLYTKHERPPKKPRVYKPGNRKPSTTPRKPRPLKPRSYPKHSLQHEAQALRDAGKSYTKIATALGVSVATAYKWLNSTSYD